MLEICSEWEVYIEEIETHFSEIFNNNSEILHYFREKIENLEQISSMSEEQIKRMRVMFQIKNDILDFVTMIRKTMDKFKPFKEKLDVIFGKTSFIVKDLE